MLNLLLVWKTYNATEVKWIGQSSKIVKNEKLVKKIRRIIKGCDLKANLDNTTKE